MARPREFEPTEALDAAMQVFWTKGYEATSMTDLMAAMKLSKSSFYDTFGCKHDVFLAAIDHYKETVGARVSAVSSLDAPARKLIASLFERAVDHMTEKDGQRGCFLNNCAVEVALHDPAAAKLVGGGFQIMEDTFLALVKRGQAEGDIAPGKDPVALSRYLTSAVHGIMVVGKVRPDHQALTDVASTALTVLD